MRGLVVVLAGLSLTGSGVAAPQSAATPVLEVRLSSFAFSPDTVHLRVGQEQVLRLVGARGSHNFSAPGLFAASRIDAPSAALVRRGTVEVGEGDVIDIRLTPLTAGSWPIRCTHLLHAAYGMKGQAIAG